jgi:ribosomal 50S subunit-recycling heat shock protein
MKTLKSAALSVGIGVFLFAGILYAAEKGQGGKPSIEKTRLVTVTATVEAVDPARRTLTLKGADGKVVTVKVGDQVKNLNQVKVGDQVVAKYYEALAIRVSKAGQTGASVEESEAKAKPGQKPAGAIVQATTITAVVKEINREDSTVTLQGPEGNFRTIKVRDPKNLKNVDVGDHVTITYTEALAISVQKA